MFSERTMGGVSSTTQVIVDSETTSFDDFQEITFR